MGMVGVTAWIGIYWVITCLNSKSYVIHHFCRSRQIDCRCLFFTQYRIVLLPFQLLILSLLFGMHQSILFPRNNLWVTSSN